MAQRENDGERRKNGASWAQTITLIVAVIGILGSVATTIIGDSLQDKRRLEQDRRGTYRALKTAADSFEDASVAKLLDAYRESVWHVRAYQNDPESLALEDKVDNAYAAHESAFERMREDWLSLAGRLDDVRMIGSPEAINLAWIVIDKSDQRYRYLADVYNELLGDRRQIRITRELKRLRNPNTWSKQKSQRDFRTAVTDYFHAITREVNSV